MNELKNKTIAEMSDEEFEAFGETFSEMLYYNISSRLSRGYYSLKDYREDVLDLLDDEVIIKSDFDKTKIRYEYVWRFEDEAPDFKAKVERIYDEVLREARNKCPFYFSKYFSEQLKDEVNERIQQGKISGIDLEIVKKHGELAYGLGKAQSSWHDRFYMDPSDLFRRFHFLATVNGMDFLDLLTNEAKMDWVMKQGLFHGDEEIEPEFDVLAFIDLCKENIKLHEEKMIEPKSEMAWNENLLRFFKGNKNEMQRFLANIQGKGDKGVTDRLSYCYKHGVITIYKGSKSDNLNVISLHNCMRELGYYKAEYNTFNNNLKID